MIHHVQQGKRLSKHINTDNILEAQTKDRLLRRSKEFYEAPLQSSNSGSHKTETNKSSRILFSNFQDWSLSRNQHTLVMELLEHPQGTMGHDDLIL